MFSYWESKQKLIEPFFIIDKYDGLSSYRYLWVFILFKQRAVSFCGNEMSSC